MRSRRLLTLDSNSWIEATRNHEGFRVELHRPVRVSGAGWVDEPAVCQAPTVQAATRGVLAGTSHDPDTAAAELARRFADPEPPV